jgi:hypothetical protein
MIMTSVVWQFATEAARIQTQVKSCGILDGQSNTGADFSPIAKVFSACFHSTNCSVMINPVIDAILYTLYTDSVVKKP